LSRISSVPHDRGVRLTRRPSTLLRFARTVGIGLVAWATACYRFEVVDYEIPNAYVGRVTIFYGAPNCPSYRGGIVHEVRVSRSGKACSASSREPTAGVDHFYYIDPQGRRVRELRRTGWNQGGEIWAESGSFDGRTKEFFVGSEQQLRATWRIP